MWEWVLFFHLTCPTELDASTSTEPFCWPCWRFDSDYFLHAVKMDIFSTLHWALSEQDRYWFCSLKNLPSEKASLRQKECVDMHASSQQPQFWSFSLHVENAVGSRFPKTKVLTHRCVIEERRVLGLTHFSSSPLSLSRQQ